MIKFIIGCICNIQRSNLRKKFYIPSINLYYYKKILPLWERLRCEDFGGSFYFLLDHQIVIENESRTTPKNMSKYMSCMYTLWTITRLGIWLLDLWFSLLTAFNSSVCFDRVVTDQLKSNPSADCLRPAMEAGSSPII